jgi:chorismate synthase
LSNSFGKNFIITTWGESHGKAFGVVIDGCPSNLELSKEDIQKELNKRKPGQSKITTQRKEEDKVEILSGVFEGKTLGTPISLIIYNQDQNLKDYQDLREIFRPGHADFTYEEKYGIRDYRGGGRSSGRETISRVAGGAIAKKILKEKNIQVIAYTKQIGDIKINKVNLNEIEKNSVRSPDKEASKKMEELILQIKNEGDSVGGICEIIIKNCPSGIGDPVFSKIKAQFANALLGIGGVTSFEYGIENSHLIRGSDYNSEFISKNGKIKSKKNNHGGILGGITTGEDIIMRIKIKPTPSISKSQKTINKDGKTQILKIKGRHDPCIVPRIIPVAESMISIVLVDNIKIL